jgi:hypothetical protein
MNLRRGEQPLFSLPARTVSAGGVARRQKRFRHASSEVPIAVKVRRRLIGLAGVQGIESALGRGNETQVDHFGAAIRTGRPVGDGQWLGGDQQHVDGAAYPHTAQQLGRSRICYPFHPFFGHEVEILRWLRRQEEPCAVVRIDGEGQAEALRIAVPRWMLDPVACQNMQTQARPRIDLRALQQLRQLLDLQNVDGSGDARGCPVEESSEGSHASTIEDNGIEVPGGHVSAQAADL